jgi:hypothetical protein
MRRPAWIESVSAANSAAPTPTTAAHRDGGELGLGSWNQASQRIEDLLDELFHPIFEGLLRRRRCAARHPGPISIMG